MNYYFVSWRQWLLDKSIVLAEGLRSFQLRIPPQDTQWYSLSECITIIFKLVSQGMSQRGEEKKLKRYTLQVISQFLKRGCFAYVWTSRDTCLDNFSVIHTGSSLLDSNTFLSLLPLLTINYNSPKPVPSYYQRNSNPELDNQSSDIPILLN